MNPKRKQRLILVIFLVVGASFVVGLVLYALKQNMNLFYNPTQIATGQAPLHSRIRAGGMVRKGSLVRIKDSLTVNFVITDFQNDVKVTYTGILPDLFREGTGVVATGMMEPNGVFHATEVLAKHDEKYMPPEVSDALKKSGRTATGQKVQPTSPQGN
jgi:cytochrome c-type biogenesis protein CcmE